MAVSTFLRWGVSLAVKSTLNARPRAVVGHRQRSDLHGCCVTRSLPRGTASGVDEVAVLVETDDAETGAGTAGLREMGVSESEVLSKDAWMARADAHRKRCVTRVRRQA